MTPHPHPPVRTPLRDRAPRPASPSGFPRPREALSPREAVVPGRSSVTLLRAEWVLPVEGWAIHDGAVAVEGARIVAVGPACDVERRLLGAPALDLGQAAILPGLVDLHTHVCWSGVAPVRLPFGEWIEAMAGEARAAVRSDLERDAARGARRLIEGGVTAVGDSGPVAEIYDAVAASGLRGTFFLEVFGPDPRSAREAFEAARDRFRSLRARARGERLAVGLAPHAPYTASEPLYLALADLARREGVRLATHLAESPEETDFVCRGAGPLAERLARRGIPVAGTGRGPVAWLAASGALDGVSWVLAHLARADAADVALLAGRARGPAPGVALCPVSNAFLGVGSPPVAALGRSGLRPGLGTDGAGTDPAQDLFAAMRACLRLTRFGPDLAARDVLRAATLDGARALGLGRETGSLVPGKLADICAVSLGPSERPLEMEPHEAVALLGARERVLLTMIDGRIVWRRNPAEVEGA